MRTVIKLYEENRIISIGIRVGIGIEIGIGLRGEIKRIYDISQ